MRLSRSPEIPRYAHECVDAFLDGRLRLIQSRDGYRFSIDAVFLSTFVSVRPGDRVVDLGTGCGVIPLILLLEKPIDWVVGVEIQAELASQAARNVLLNRLSSRMKVIRGDIRHPPLAEACADVVICNPPYRQHRSGRINPDPRRAIARHEILASINDILLAAQRLLRKKGRFAFVYPSTRLAEVFGRLKRFDLEPKRLQISYPDLESGAKLALIEAVLGARPGLDILPPLLGQGDFSISNPP
ncbi:MAG: methyltransferase [Desulfatiglandaceae bacterium]